MSIFPIGGRIRAQADGRTADRGWPPAAGVGLSWLIPQLRVAAGLAALGVTGWVNLRTPHPGLSGPGAESLIALMVAGVAWLAWMAVPPRSPGGLVALAAMGGRRRGGIEHLPGGADLRGGRRRRGGGRT